MPALGWSNPDKKTYRLNIPMTEDVRVALCAKAAKLGITQTELARNILTRAVMGPPK